MSHLLHYSLSIYIQLSSLGEDTIKARLSTASVKVASFLLWQWIFVPVAGGVCHCLAKKKWAAGNEYVAWQSGEGVRGLFVLMWASRRETRRLISHGVLVPRAATTPYSWFLQGQTFTTSKTVFFVRHLNRRSRSGAVQRRDKILLMKSFKPAQRSQHAFLI